MSKLIEIHQLNTQERRWENKDTSYYLRQYEPHEDLPDYSKTNYENTDWVEDVSPAGEYHLKRIGDNNYLYTFISIRDNHTAEYKEGKINVEDYEPDIDVIDIIDMQESVIISIQEAYSRREEYELMF